MNIKLCFLFWGALLFSSNIQAQFYTLKSDSIRIAPYRIIKKHTKRNTAEAVKDNKNKRNLVKMEKSDKLVGSVTQDTLSSLKTPPVTLFSNTLEKLKERLNVCLPLDFLHINSQYGYRKDPFSQTSKFHNGIDLACKNDNVYSMLPAIVKKVHRGKKGYGNYVILNHGQLECLYAHLEEITVREKEVINAGTIVGISGNTGKSTGHHLHISLKNNGKSVDPLPFILFIKTYIEGLNKELADIVEPSPEVLLIRQKSLSIANVYAELINYNIQHPQIVLSQAILETGNFTSRVCNEHNNLFGLRKKNGEYYKFERWEDSIRAYRDYVQYKYRGGDYFTFLDRIGYAEDKAYTLKVRIIADGIKHKVRGF